MAGAGLADATPLDHGDGLPPGVEDAVLNKARLGDALAVSITTLDRWIADGMPFVEGGTNGRAYQFRLSECYRWCRDKQRQRVAAKEAGDRAVAQMRLALLGGSMEDTERQLSPKERGELYEAERQWTRLAIERGDVIPKGKVTEVLEEVLSLVRSGVLAMPDRLEREAALTGRQAETAAKVGDEILDAIKHRLAVYIEETRASAPASQLAGLLI